MLVFNQQFSLVHTYGTLWQASNEWLLMTCCFGHGPFSSEDDYSHMGPGSTTCQKQGSKCGTTIANRDMHSSWYEKEKLRRPIEGQPTPWSRQRSRVILSVYGHKQTAITGLCSMLLDTFFSIWPLLCMTWMFLNKINTDGQDDNSANYNHATILFGTRTCPVPRW